MRPPFNIDVTCMKHGLFSDLVNGFNFIVMLNAFTYGFQEVSGFEIIKQFDNYNEGGVNSHSVVAGAPNQNTMNLQLKRGILISDTKSSIGSAAKALASWIPNNQLRKAALLGLASSDPTFALETGPAIGFIQVFDRNFKHDVLTLTFFSLGVSEWRLSGLDAMNSTNLIVEDMTILHTGLRRLATNITPNFYGIGVTNRTKPAEEGYYYRSTSVNKTNSGESNSDTSLPESSSENPVAKNLLEINNYNNKSLSHEDLNFKNRIENFKKIRETKLKKSLYKSSSEKLKKIS